MLAPRRRACITSGWGNYIDLLTDKEIWQRFVFTGKFVLATLSIQFVIGIAAAYAFHHDFRGRDLLFTTSTHADDVLPDRRRLSLAIYVQQPVGAGELADFLASASAKIDWLGISEHALWAVAIADAWTWTPFVILLATAAFRGIPKDILRIGSSRRSVARLHFFHVTLPMSLPIILIAFLLRLIDAFKQFDLFVAMTGGGPGSETETAAYSLSKMAFGYFQTGKASAFAIILLVLILGLSMVFVRYLTSLSNRV